jgi:site-specific DNA-adenine methylase
MNIWKYISTFLGGVSLAFALAFMLALKKINVTNADTVIESLEQSIKKLKQDGQGNVSDMAQSVVVPESEQKMKKELRKEKRAERKAHRNN